MKVHIHPLGPIQTNCYVVEDDEKNCLIFDPGDEAHALIMELKKLSLKPHAIFLTHAHFDHIGAVDAVRDEFGIPVYLHEAEQDWLADASLNGSGKYPMFPNITARPADHLLTDEKQFTAGPFSMEIRRTPGHSPGSVSYIFEEAGFAIVGDTLFQGSIGRTDLVGGSMETLLSSIHSELLTLDDELLIYPGHGPATTPSNEKDSNPFLHGF